MVQICQLKLGDFYRSLSKFKQLSKFNLLKVPWSLQLTKGKEQEQVSIVNNYKHALQASPGGMKQTEKCPKRSQVALDIIISKKFEGVGFEFSEVG